MIRINLVPDVKLELIKAQRHRNAVISISVIAMIISVAVVVALGFVIAGQAYFEARTTSRIKELDEKLMNIDDIEKVVTIQNQLSSIQTTHKQKSITSRVFGLLAQASGKGTDNSVSFNSFAIDTGSQTISIVAQTDSRGFDAAEVFRKNVEGMRMYFVPADQGKISNEFKKDPLTRDAKEKSVPIASDVVLSDLSYAESDKDKRKTVSFRLTFTYDKQYLFNEEVDILRFQGDYSGNVTDSYKRLPTSLFDTSRGAGNGEQAQ